MSRQNVEWKTIDPESQRIIPGLFIYQATAGKTVTRNLDLIRSQYQLCRRQGAKGVSFFSLQYLSDPLIWVCRTQFFPAESPAYIPPARK